MNRSAQSRRFSRRSLLGFGAGLAAVIAMRAGRISAGGPAQVRRNAKTLSSTERNRFVSAVKALKEIPSSIDPSDNAYDYFVRIHFAAYYDDIMPAHMAPA